MNEKTRRLGYLVLAAILAAGTATLWGLSSANQHDASAEAEAGAEVVVYKSPTCGCCEAWVEHMKEAGFSLRVENRTDLVMLKQQLGIPPTMFSCHTAVIGGQVVEGHVPASTVQRYLSAGAPGEGLAVPGMPPGSPGMPSLNPKPYDVYSFDGGRTSVFESR